MSALTSGSEPSVSLDTEIVDESTVVNESDAGDVDAAEVAAGRFGRFSWTRILVYGVLPGLALILALSAGYLKWQGDLAREAEATRIESVRTATDSAIAMLSYRPDTVDKDLTAARDRMTGSFRDDYTKLITDVVIPGAKEKQISAVAAVPAAASVSATENHAVVLIFVNQNVVIGNDPPTTTASSVRITLDKIEGRWLVSRFDPV